MTGAGSTLPCKRRDNARKQPHTRKVVHVYDIKLVSCSCKRRGNTRKQPTVFSNATEKPTRTKNWTKKSRKDQTMIFPFTSIEFKNCRYNIMRAKFVIMIQLKENNQLKFPSAWPIEPVKSSTGGHTVLFHISKFQTQKKVKSSTGGHTVLFHISKFQTQIFFWEKSAIDKKCEGTETKQCMPRFF
jgi:hypothetical protein